MPLPQGDITSTDIYNQPVEEVAEEVTEEVTEEETDDL